MKRVIGAFTALSLFLAPSSAALAGGSTINTGVPAQGSPLQSAPIRNNFVAAATDINNLMSMFAGSSAPASPVTFQLWANPGVNPAPIQIFDGTQFVLTGTLDRIAHTYSPALGSSSIAGTPPITASFSGTTATVAITLDSNFAVTASALALNPISAGQLLANCTNALAEPTACSWNSFANQAISSTNGALPYRTGGTWGTIFTGTSGGTIPLNSTANVFSQLQAVNLNTSALPSPQSGALGQWQQADSVIGRLEVDTTGQPAILTGLRADGTAASPTTLVANDEILSLNAWGYDGTSRGASGGAGRISIFAGGTWSNTSHPTYIDFGTTAASTVTLTSRGHIENDGGLTWPSTVTGGSKGSGSINAQSIFINGAALSAAAANLTVGTSVINSGTATRVLFDNGTLGEYSISGSGNVAMTTSPAFTTPALGVATATSLAVNGAAIGSNALAVTGTTALGGATIDTGTVAPASAAGNTVVLGTLAAVPTLSNTGQAFLFNTTAGGLIIQGDGSTNDISIYNKSGSLVWNVPTGTTVPQLPGLASGTCASGLAIDSSTNIIKASCPGSASAIQVTGTSVTTASGTNRLLTEGTVTGGTGTLADTPVTGDSSGNLAAVNSIAGSVVATKAQQQTGSSSTNVVTPGQQQSHDSAAKAHALLDGSSAGTCTVREGYNISGCTRATTGSYTVTFSTAFASALGYACVFSATNSAGNIRIPYYTAAQTTTVVTFHTSNLSGTDSDSDTINLACYGRQ